MLAALLLAVVAGSIVASPVAAAGPDRFKDLFVATYELQPSRGVIHVTINYRITIHRQNYYYFGAERYIEHDATNLKVKPSSGTASIRFLKKTSGDWRLVRIDYSRLYDGQSRQFTISYDLPAGGPRSTAERRAGYAWADFCAAGFGGDEGEVRVVMPAGFAVVPTRSMRSTVKGGKRTWTSGHLKSKPWQFYGCFEGSDPTAYRSTGSQADPEPSSAGGPATRRGRRPSYRRSPRPCRSSRRCSARVRRPSR